MNETAETRPIVSDVIRETGVSASELAPLVPGLSIHMARHIVRGTTTGVRYARPLARALRNLSRAQGRDGAQTLKDAAARLEDAYPAPPSVAREPDDTDALVIHLAKQQEPFAAIGRRIGISRQAVHQRVTAYERRTGETIPRRGTDY